MTQPKPKVLVVGGERYDIPFHPYGDTVFDVDKFIDNPFDNYKLVVLTGGEDIEPSSYGVPKEKQCGWTNKKRDMLEFFIARVATTSRIPIVGICRGAQLLNVHMGGHLVQHCNNHDMWHHMRTKDGRNIFVSSTHHQMMIPAPAGVVAAWASPRQSTVFYGGGKNPKPWAGKMRHPEVEAEVVLYPRVLCIQYHPEYMKPSSAGFRYAQELVEKHLGVERQADIKQGWFISLPKKVLIPAEREAEEKKIRKMTKAARDAYFAEKYKESFIENSIRKSMAQLWPEADARLAAEEEYEKLLEAMNNHLAEVSTEVQTKESTVGDQEAIEVGVCQNEGSKAGQEE